MKKVFLVLMTIVAISSCTKDDASNQRELNLVTSLDNSKASSSNPLEYIGEFHNIALAQAMETRDDSYEDIVLHLSDLMGEDLSSFGQLDQLQINMDPIVGDGYGYYTHLWVEGYIEDHEKTYLRDLESVLLSSVPNDQFVIRTDQLVNQVLNDEQLSDDSRNTLLGTISLAKHSYLFWDHQEQGGRASRANGKFWADIGGFVGGFTGALTYNNNNGGGTDVNPFSTGVAIGGFASSQVDKEKD